jgi:hypothetical protein
MIANNEALIKKNVDFSDFLLYHLTFLVFHTPHMSINDHLQSSLLYQLGTD